MIDTQNYCAGAILPSEHMPNLLCVRLSLALVHSCLLEASNSAGQCTHMEYTNYLVCRVSLQVSVCRARCRSWQEAARLMRTRSRRRSRRPGNSWAAPTRSDRLPISATALLARHQSVLCPGQDAARRLCDGRFGVKSHVCARVRCVMLPAGREQACHQCA